MQSGRITHAYTVSEHILIGVSYIRSQEAHYRQRVLVTGDHSATQINTERRTARRFTIPLRDMCTPASTMFVAHPRAVPLHAMNARGTKLAVLTSFGRSYSIYLKAIE